MQDQPASVSIQELLAGNVQLASPPEIFLKINQILDNPNWSSAEVSHLIEHDPGLAARLLKIVNSALFHFPSQITSIKQAVNVIGFQDLRDLVLATLVVERFSSLPNGLISMRSFWMISVRRGLLAKRLAERHPQSQRLHACFICGLLHHIGRLVIYQRLPEPARAAVLLSARENIPEHTAQRRVLGFDHYDVGAELGRRWRLPEVIVATIAAHDAPESAGAYAVQSALVSMASELCTIDYQAPENLETELRNHADLWASTELDRSILDEALAEAESEFIEVFTKIYKS
ncbi:MAG: hypothetical protein H6R26_2996 [Proteobacteria bacterium]|nr:hypothetical protein [Pseudomonadota bacterium]